MWWPVVGRIRACRTPRRSRRRRLPLLRSHTDQCRASEVAPLRGPCKILVSAANRPASPPTRTRLFRFAGRARQRKRVRGNPMASKLYVGGLAYSTTSEGLREFFAQSGNVLSATVITDRFSGQSRGFGFVEMGTAEEAQNAISQLNGRELDGRRITVEISNPQGSRSGGGGGGGRPGGGRPGGGRPGGGGGGGRESGYAHRPSKPVKW